MWEKADALEQAEGTAREDSDIDLVVISLILLCHSPFEGYFKYMLLI